MLRVIPDRGSSGVQLRLELGHQLPCYRDALASMQPNITRRESMHITLRTIALGLGLVVAAGCAGQQVTTEYSPATSFFQYKTFALVMPPDTGAQQLLDQRVRNAVQAQLSARGLTLADRENAELY